MTSIEVKTIFKASQHLGNHQKCLKDINKIVEKTISKTTKQTLKKQREFVENLFKGPLLLVLYNDPKSPYVKTAIKFVVSFIYGLMKEEEENNDTSENRENRHPDVSQDDIGAEAFDEPNPKQMLADRIIMDLVQKWLYNKYTNIRVNGIILIRLLLKECCNNQISISSNTYETIRDSLIERFADKDIHVRTETALAMEWFQDADVVASAYQFHMTKDPCSNVRRNCLLVTQNHNLLVSHGIRDIEAINRKTAYTKIGATKIRKFTIDQRIKIIKTGIRERNKAVKKTFVEKLLLQWYNTELKATGDVINFIKLFDVQSDVELHDQMLGIIFNYLLERTEYIQDFRYTAFHKLLFNFCKKYLSKQTKSLNIKWSVDHTFLWRRFAEFCRDENITVFVNKTHDDGELEANEAEGSQGAGAESGEAQAENSQIQVPEIDSQMGPADLSQDQGQNEPSSLPVPFLDYIIPDVPNFCQYVNELVTHVIDSELTELELDDCEFIFNELMKIALIYDLTDDVERKNMFELCDSVINNGNLKDKFINNIPSLMKCLAQKYFSDSFESLSQYTLNLIHEVLSLVDHQDHNTNEQEAQLKKKFVVTEEEINQIEMKWAKLTVEINELRDQLEEAKGRSEFLKAQGIKDKIDVLIREREELAQKRLAIKSVEAEQEPEEPAELDQLPKIIRHRNELHRCLLLLHGSLRYGKIKKGDISPPMKQSIEEICLKGGLMSEYIEDRELGVRSLGIACMYDAGLSKDRFWLLTEILKRDEISVQNIALEAIFDILCSHGFGVFDDIDPQDKDKSDTSLNLDHHRSFAKNDQSEDSEMKSDEDTEDENENDEDKQEKETFNEIEGSQAQSQEEIDANFNQFLTRFFIFLLESHEDIIKLTASKGIGKLMLFGRLQSQILFSKLVLMWYDNESNAELKEYLGLFLPFFAQHNIHGIKGQASFEDCFIPLIEQVFYDKIEYVPMENMINFLSDLTSDEVHSRLVLSISNKILTQTFNNDISSHLVYALTQMRLDKMEKRRLKEFKILINQMKNDVQQVKEGAKKKKLFDSINKIGKKIDYYLDKLAKDNANSNHLDDSFQVTNDIQPSSTQPNGTQLVLDSHSGDIQTGDIQSQTQSDQTHSSTTQN